jgi:hypothetical protein
MLSKCANPGCSEVFRYLHQGKVFLLSPTPEVLVVTGNAYPSLHERFWLCDKCSKEMTVVWVGRQVKLVPLPVEAEPVAPLLLPPASNSETSAEQPRTRAASVGRQAG